MNSIIIQHQEPSEKDAQPSENAAVPDPGKDDVEARASS